jgi:hypothetical protein
VRTWRIDDVSVNTDVPALIELIEACLSEPDDRVLLAINPVVIGKDRQRPFPAAMKPLSVVSEYFKATNLGLPQGIPFSRWNDRVITAGHGMVHVDHRLLTYEQQELSILMSCSLARADNFVPPFNYWNGNTQAICVKHGIQLIKYEDGWRHVLHNKFNPNHLTWYLHPWDITVDGLRAWRQSNAPLCDLCGKSYRGNHVDPVSGKPRHPGCVPF